MSFSVVDTVRGAAEGWQGITDAWTAPQRAAELRKQREERARQEAERSALRRDGLESARQQVQLMQGALPLAEQVRAIQDKGKDQELDRTLRGYQAQANIAGGLLNQKGDVQAKIIGADYQGKLGLDQLKYDKALQIIGGQQGHELAVMDRFFGDVPLAERASLDRDRDRQLALQMMDMAKPTWLQQAASVIGPAALAAAAFIG